MSKQVNSLSFLEFARDISDSSSEIYQRNAVSRAYYSIYHMILENFSPIPKIQGKGSHESLEIHLSNLEYDSEDKELLNTLIEIMKSEKKKRTIADYKLKRKVGELDAQQSIFMAEECRSLIDSIIKEK